MTDSSLTYADPTPTDGLRLYPKPPDPNGCGEPGSPPPGELGPVLPGDPLPPLRLLVEDDDDESDGGPGSGGTADGVDIENTCGNVEHGPKPLDAGDLAAVSTGGYPAQADCPS